MKTRKFLATMATILFALSVSAQEIMNLRQCMEYALRNSTQKTMQQADFDDALLQRRDAILSAFTPTISAGTHAYTNFGRTIDPETNSYISMTSFSNSYSLQAGMTLFNGFAALNNIKIAKTAVRMGKARTQQVDDEICLAVMQAYYNVVFRQEMMVVLEAQRRTFREHLTLIQRQYDLGQKGYADVAQVEADLAEREYLVVKAENEKNEALLNLKAILMWKMDDSLRIDCSTEQDMPQRDESSSFNLLAYATTFQPAALLAKGKMECAKYEWRTARGRFLPTLSVNGGWSTNFYTYPGKADYKAPSFASQFHNNGGEYVQLSLSFPLYDRLSRQTNLRRKKNAYKRATATYRQTLKEIEVEVTRAVQDSKGAQAAFTQAEKRLDAQTAAYQLSERKFALGLISPVEYQTVASAYLNAKAERLNTLLQYQLKQSVVKYYKGISYLEQQK